MKRATWIRLFTALLWFGSLFIKLYEHESRGEVVEVHVYSLYGWVIVLLRQFGEVLSRGKAVVAVVLSAAISLCHVILCYVAVRLAFWLGLRLRHSRRRGP